MFIKSLHLAVFIIFIVKNTVYSIQICSTDNDPCKCVLEGGQVIDISSVGVIDRPRYFEVKSNNSEDNKLYSYNPCYPFDSKDQPTRQEKGTKPCIKAAACTRTPGGNDGSLPEEHAIGLQSTAIFGRDDKGEYHINYTVPDFPKKLKVLLQCTNISDHHELTIHNNESSSADLYIMTLESKCACINGCPSSIPPGDDSGLSLGSKLLIVFFTVFLAYFIVGILWNCFNGAKGTELIPNVEFWNEIPKLIIEGISFTCSCFGRRSSYGEV